MQRTRALFPWRRETRPRSPLSLSEAGLTESQDGQTVLTFVLPELEALFDRFDGAVEQPYRRLNPEFVDSLLYRIGQVSSDRFDIHLKIAQETEAMQCDTARCNLKNFFSNLETREQRTLLEVLRNGLLLMSLGAGVVTVLIQSGAYDFPPPNGFSIQLWGQAWTIFAWVTIWDGIAKLLWGWQPHRSRIKLYRQVQAANVCFDPVDVPAIPHASQMED